MKRSIYIMALGVFGIITTEFGVIGILPTLAKEFNISIDKAGWLLSAFAFTVALSGPFMTMLTARVNRKVMMCLVLGVFILSNLISAFAPNFTVLMIARILPAILHPVFWVVAMTVAAKQAGPKDAPKAIATVMTGLSVATVLGIPITTYASDMFNWKASFFLSGIINLIAFLALVTMIPSMPVAREEGKSQGQLAYLREPKVWFNLFTSMVILAGMFSTYGYLAEFLSKVSKMSGAQISIMLLLFGGTGIAGNWAMGIALSRNSRLTSRLYLPVLAAIHLLAYSIGGYFVPMVLLLSVWGFIHTGGFLVANINITKETPPQYLELINGLLASFFNIGIMLGTMFGGMIIARYSIHEVVWMSVVLLLAAFGLSFVPVGKKREAEKAPTTQARSVQEWEPAAEAVGE